MKIHADKSDPDGTFAHEEFRQIEAQLNYERTLDSTWRSFLVVPSHRKRALIGFACMFFAQCTGTQVINSMSPPAMIEVDAHKMPDYGPLLYSKLGFSTADSLIVQAGWITWGVIGNFINALLLDRVGRKWLMSKTLHLSPMIEHRGI
jgi:hypothetical protein